MLEDVTLLTRPDYEKGQSSKTEIGEALGHMISLRRDRYTKWNNASESYKEISFKKAEEYVNTAAQLSPNVKKFIRTDGGYVEMSNGARVMISRRKKEEFIEVMNTYINKK